MAKKLTGIGLLFNKTPATRAPELRPVLLNPDVTGRSPASVRVLIADKYGRVRGELMAQVEGVAWKLNKYGQARFIVPRADATAREDFIQFGNRVLIQFGNGLPDWGGVIDTPRNWAPGVINVTAYSAEYLLGWRVTPRAQYFNSAAVGRIFKDLIETADPVGVGVGSVWVDGTLYTPEYHYRQLYEIITRDLASVEAGDWNVSSRLVDGQIQFLANYYGTRGQDWGRRMALVEGKNVADAEYSEQGDIVNDVLVAGSGTSWAEEDRLVSRATDEPSQGKYGLRQAGEVRVNIKDQSTLDAYAAVKLYELKEPRRVVSVSALDFNPARFHQYDLGDTLWLELYTSGFNGYASSVRIVAREFLPSSNMCSLVIEQ